MTCQDPSSRSTAPAAAPELADSLVFNLSTYGPHHLQRVATWEPREPNPDPNARWVIFLHGGAWRDPTNTYADFLPTINALSSLKHIRGLASIDYRLSPHPSHPQSPDTSSCELRSAQHPEHIHDIHAALAYLQENHDISGYILAGHSVGATLAFQLLMGPQASGLLESDAPLPAGILALAGIYEFRDFANRNGAPYVTMIEGALGPNQDRWNDAAPLYFCENYASAWSGTHILLSYSGGDTLVDGAVETVNMAARLLRDGCVVSTTPIHGEHDFVWQDGKQIADLIKNILQRVQ